MVEEKKDKLIIEDNINEKDDDKSEQVEDSTEPTVKQDEQVAPEENKEAENKKSSVERHYTKGSNTVPAFLESAEKVPSRLQEALAAKKRSTSDRYSELTEDDLLYAEGETVETFNTGNETIKMLKMRVIENDAPIYVPVNYAGANYRNLESFIGRKVRVGITRFVQTNEGEVGAEYIALGSIQEAEFIVAGRLYSQYLKDPDAVKNEVREGTVVQILERPNERIERDNRSITIYKSIVFVDYKGITLGIRESDFHYPSLVKPLSERVFIGQKIEFRITRIRKGDYQDSESVKADAEEGHPVPQGIRYYVDTSRLSFLKNPDTDIREKLNSKTVFKANIVAVDAVKGILVEVAPFWRIKGYLPASFPQKPTKLDEIEHTPVTVRLNKIDFKTKSGQCQILRFPQGVARAGISDQI